MNCQGLGNFEKRKDVFNYIHGNFKNSNIICLQDTHFVPEKENLIRSQWGFDCIFNSFTSNSRGVCVLFHNNFQYKVNNIKSDLNGNFLILDISIDDRRFTLVNLYGPNNDSPAFF